MSELTLNQKSTNGTRPTESERRRLRRALRGDQEPDKIASGLEKNNLTAENVLELIKVGASAGVAKIKFGDLELEFGQTSKPPDSGEREAPAPTDAAMSAEQSQKEEKLALEREEIRTREDQIEHMVIENPLKAEELIADGELEPDVDNDGHSES